MMIKEYHERVTECWKMFHAVYAGKQSTDWAVYEGGRIVQDSGGNKMIKNIVFAMWKELEDTEKERRRAKE